MPIRFLNVAFVIAVFHLPAIGLPNANAGDTNAVAADTSKSMPERIGLVDLGYVFKNYEKFLASQDSIKTEIASLSLKAQQLTLEAKQIELALNRAEPGSRERAELEQEMLKKRRQFEDYQRTSRQSLIKQESNLYKTVYFEVMDAVRDVAKEQNFTLVIRFDREHLDPAESNVDAVKKGLNRQVIYFRDRSDLTEIVLKRLNADYSKGGTGQQAAP